jgi:hypothetical protein
MSALSTINSRIDICSRWVTTTVRLAEKSTVAWGGCPQP